MFRYKMCALKRGLHRNRFRVLMFYGNISKKFSNTVNHLKIKNSQYECLDCRIYVNKPVDIESHFLRNVKVTRKNLLVSSKCVQRILCDLSRVLCNSEEIYFNIRLVCSHANNKYSSEVES